MRLLVCSAAVALATVVPGPTFHDAGGDASGAPDVTSVTAASDATGITFTIRTATASTWENAAAILDIDAGGDGLTYVLHSLHDQFTLDRSNGDHVAHPAATATLAGATLTIAVPFSELGHPQTIGFRVSTPGPTGEDVAPDTGAWHFSPGATVTAIAASFTPAVHSRTLSLRGVATSFSDGTSGAASATCTAKLGATRLPGTNCSWRLPASSRGATLQVSVSAAGLRRAYSLRIR